MTLREWCQMIGRKGGKRKTDAKRISCRQNLESAWRWQRIRRQIVLEGRERGGEAPRGQSDPEVLKLVRIEKERLIHVANTLKGGGMPVGMTRPGERHPGPIDSIKEEKVSQNWLRANRGSHR